MRIRPRRPKSGHKGNCREGGGSQYHESRVPCSSEDTTLLGSTRPRTIRTRSCYNRISELCHHWRWDNRPRVRKKRQTNIYNYSCLRINCLSTNSLTALMWRWYLNSKEAAVKFQEALDGTERNLPNPTYTCVVRMEHRGWYINWKKSMQKMRGSEDKKKREAKIEKEEKKEK